MRIDANDARLSWLGAVSLHRTEDWVMPWRIPFDERSLYPEALRERASMPAGVRIAFQTDSDNLSGEIVPNTDTERCDVFCDGQLIESVDIAGQQGFRLALPAGEKLVEIWLPQFGEFRLRSLGIADGSTFAATTSRRPRWVTYGSSITQCRTAASPSRTWPSIVARACGLDLTCLGYGGQCHLDPMLARLIRDLPADFISICAGINIYGAASLGPRAFGPALIGTIRTVREQHPVTPIALISPIFSATRETVANAVGFTLESMREEIRRQVDILRESGDTNVFYVDGLTLFGPDLARYLPDDLHPDAEGYQILGDNFVRLVAPRLTGKAR